MAIELDLSQDNGERDAVAPGKAQAIFTKFNEYAHAKSGSHTAEFEIVAHDDKEQNGKTPVEFFSSKAGAAFRLKTLAIAVGLATAEECEKAKEEGRAVSMEFNDAIGRQLFITLSEEEYQGRKSVKIGPRAMYHLTDEKAKNHPRNVGMLKRSGVPLDKIPGPGSASSATSASPAAKSQTPPPPAPPADDLFKLS